MKGARLKLKLLDITSIMSLSTRNHCVMVTYLSCPKVRKIITYLMLDCHLLRRLTDSAELWLYHVSLTIEAAVGDLSKFLLLAGQRFDIYNRL